MGKSSIVRRRARKIYDWFTDIEMDGRALPGRLRPIARLPGKLVIDHIGRVLAAKMPLDHPAVATR